MGGGGGGGVRLRLPPIRNAATALAVGSIVSSVLWWLLRDGPVLYLMPPMVLTGAVWQLVSWIPATVDTAPVLFTALIIWSTGGQLEMHWGRRHFLLFALLIPFVTGVLTVALSLVFPRLVGPFMGGDVLFAIMWVGYGCLVWNGQTNFWGFPLTGKTLAFIGVLMAALNGVFRGIWTVIPVAIALVLTFLHVRFRWPMRQLEAFGSWRLQRDLKKRSAHLRSVSSDQRNMPTDSDRFLH